MFYNIAVFVMRIVTKILFRYETVGAEKIPSDVPLVICSNHKNNWDPVFVSVNLKPKIHWMGKSELWNNPLMGKLISALGVFPVNRDETDLKAIKTAISILKQNKALGIFIEGRRVKEIDYNNAKPGAVAMAHKASAMIVPVYIEGDYSLFKKMKLIVRDPIDIRDLPKQKSEGYEALAVDVLKSIYSGVEKN